MSEPAPSAPSVGIAATFWAAYAIAVRRLSRSKFMWANLWFAFFPLLIGLVVAFNIKGDYDIAKAHETFEIFLRTLYVGFVTFFLANVFGFAVVRQEFDGRTLHYLLLQPPPRWILFAGRYFAYITIVFLFSSVSLFACYGALTFVRLPAGDVVDALLRGGRLFVLVKEAGVLAAGLAAYGAIAMLAGSYFKSAMYTVLLLSWEWALPFLPQVLKQWTIIYYLQSMMPEKPSSGTSMFEVLGELASGWQCAAVFALVSAIALSAALLRFQYRECQYSET